MRTLISIIVTIFFITRFPQIEKVFEESGVGKIFDKIELSTDKQVFAAGLSESENVLLVDSDSHQEVIVSGEIDLKFERGRLSEILVWSKKNETLELRGIVDQKTKIKVRNKKIGLEDIDLINGKKVLIYGSYISGGRGKEEFRILRNVEIFVVPKN